LVLSARQVDAFVERGFVRLEAAFPRSLALTCQSLLWDQLAPMVPDDPSTWNRPVVRLRSQGAPPFRQAVASPRWLDAIQQLAGPKAQAHAHLAGTVVARFPVDGDPGDDGWHIDASYQPDDHDDWWVNHRSRERALLMLVLLSDIGEDDAPTRLRVGSHHDIARGLVPFGERGVPFSDTSELVATTEHRSVDLATGQAGDVYLCHPFLVHAAQPHRGTTPRFLAQPGVLLTEDYTRDDTSPVAAVLA
jgi:ectoine hydroxylase-related dioxygenase (phytanoyl-CoA dioxygenase family)